MCNQLINSQKRNALRRLRFLSTNLSKQISKKSASQKTVQYLINRIDLLIRYLKQRVQVGTIRQAMGSAAVVVSLFSTGKVSAQNFLDPVPLSPIISNDFLIPQLVDFDGDGDLDIIGITLVENEDSYREDYVTYYIENEGTASEFSYLNVEVDKFDIGAIPAIFLEAADFDNDGDIDLCYLEYQNDEDFSVLAFQENDGNGAFSEGLKINIPQSVFIYASDLAAAGFDGDGDTDLLTMGYDTQLYASGQGAFTSLYYIENISTNQSISFAEPIANPNNFDPIAFDEDFEVDIVQLDAEDFDGDGDIDVIYNPTQYDTTNMVFYYENTGVDFAEPKLIEQMAGFTAYTLLTSGDLDDDGDIDILYERIDNTTVQQDSSYFYFVENATLSDIRDEVLDGDFGLLKNPVEDRLVISYKLEISKDELIFNIVNQVGAVMSQNVLTNDNEGTLVKDVSGLPKGLYYINITQGRKTKVLKFVKI